jgi:hypothetical protein
MKQINISIIGLAALLTFCGCGEGFLFKDPQGSIDKNALANEQGIELVVTNSYANLTENAWGASIFNWALSGVYGGDANKGSDNSDQSVLNEVELYATLSTNSYLSDKWGWVYKGAKRVNMAMQIIDMAEDVDENFKTVRRGELHLLRAMFYFEGVKVFGPYIPYIDESFEENDPKVHNDRDIYPDILADVDLAISELPERPSEPGRIYKWVAKTLKAKILMQTGDLAGAKPILADVLANGATATGKKYALASDQSSNWDSFRDNTSPESIWEIQFSADGPNDNGNPGMAICYPHNSGPGGCCGFYQPSFELANSFQVDDDGLPYLNGEYRTKASVSVKGPGNPDTEDFIINSGTVDPRLDFAVGRYGIPYKDYGLPAGDWLRDINNGGIFMPKKHVYSKAEADAGLGRPNMYDGWAPGSAMNIQYLSVRDAMLLHAECLAGDGELSAAMDLVNQIRTRAGLDVNIIKNSDGTPAANYKVSLYPRSHAAYTDRETCIKAVRMERKLELAMEGQRFFDLARWGGDYMSTELTAYINYEKQYIVKFAAATPLPPAKTMFPIPDGQIQTMGNDENGQPYLVQPAPWQE